MLLKLLRFWSPVVLYAGLIFWVSSLPNLQAPALFPHTDKVIHTVEYALLGWLLARALTHTTATKGAGTVWVLVVALAILYGMSDEYHQSFVVGRQCDIWDLMMDMIGGAIGGWLYRY